MACIPLGKRAAIVAEMLESEPCLTGHLERKARFSLQVGDSGSLSLA